jgi:hypothetical protein
LNSAGTPSSAMSMPTRTSDNDRQTLLHQDRVNVVFLEAVEATHANVIVELSRLVQRPVERHRRRVLTAARQIDLDQMNAAIQNRALFAAIKLAAFFAGSFTAKLMAIESSLHTSPKR